MPRFAAPYVPRFVEILHAIDLFEGFALVPVEIAASEITGALVDWISQKGRKVHVVEPAGDAWRTLPAMLFALSTTPQSVVVLLGSADDTPDVRMGLRLVNQRRDSIAKHLDCPMLWCGPAEFFNRTGELAPDFWSIREIERRIDVVPDVSRVTSRAERILEPAPSPGEIRPLYEAAKAQGDEPNTARIGLRLARAGIAWGQIDEAAKLAEEARALFEKMPADRGAAGAAECAEVLGDAARARGKVDEAEERYHEALEIAERLADGHLTASASRRLGMVAEERGDGKAAEAWYRKALGIAESLGDKQGSAASQDDLTGIALTRGDAAEAEARARQALSIFEKLGDRDGAATALSRLEEIAQARLDVRAAPRAHGAASSELRLLFAKSDGALTYRLAISWGGDAGEPRPFEPFLTDADYEDLRWYLEDFMLLPIGGAKVRAARIERSLAPWGRRLFDLVFGIGDHRELYNELVDGKDTKLLTVGTANLDVLRLPWELMADSRGPLTRRGVTIRRQLEAARRSVTYETGTLPLRILLAVSRPDDTGFIDPRHTTRAMLDALLPLGEGVVVDFCRPATLPKLETMLRDAERAGHRYHIVHFDGHGTFLPASQIGALCFEKEENASGKVATDFVRADRLGDVLTAHTIPLAILEACHSGQLGSVAAFRGVATALIEAGVGSVLSMSHAVHVEAAKILLARFYEELQGGASIGTSVEQGRGAMMANPERWLARGPGAPTVELKDWFLPNLYQRGQDLVLVPGGAEKAPRSVTKPEARRQPATGHEAGAFPGKPMYGFFGRAWELHQIERRFLKHRAVLLHAMGGMGKTSLAREAAQWWTRTGLFPDGACFVSFEQAGGARRVVQVLGAYFEGAEFERRSEEEQTKRARELFQTQRVLVVWDNFESVLPAFQEGEAVAPYPDEERAAIYKLFESWMEEDKGLGRLLVTCRPGETGLRGVCKVELAGLALPDALYLLYEIMKRSGVTVTYEREALVDLLKAVEMHPLSIKLVGPHLKDMGPEKIVADFQALLDTFKGEATEGRNRSLKASIAFSLKRLSQEAQEAVRWLGMFRGGVFEDNLLDVSKMDAATWEAARGELEATALVGVEREININGEPYLRFHPTLAVAAGDGAVEAGVRERYIGVYLAVMGGIDKAFHGSNPRWGMEVMAREETNFRRAVGWALEQGAYDRASAMGETLALYLQRAGRLRERVRWVAWLAGEVRRGGFSAAAAVREGDEACMLLGQGHPKEAIDGLLALIERLKNTTEFDAAFSLANMTDELGRFYVAVGWAQKAVPVLKDVMQQWEALVDKALAAGKSGDAERGNLAATLGDLANALGDAGALDEALAAAEQALAIHIERGDHHSIAIELGRTAWILAKHGRHADADTRYDEALQAAQRAGDRELEGSLLQNQGSLATDSGQLDRAAKLYRYALQLFQDMHDDEGVMQTCNLLGVVEQKAGRLAEARAWYERSREMAKLRGDQQNVGGAALNLGVVCQLEGKAAQEQRDEARARERFAEALRFVGESLAIMVENQNEPGIASSHGQLARIHLLLGDLDQAEEHAHRTRAIHERLGLKEAWKDYDTLANISRARNDATEAAAWEQKRDTLLEELRHRAGAPVVPEQLIQALGQLALACAQIGLEGKPLDAAAEESLATVAAWPAPLDTVAPFLRALAAGTLPASIPPSLPPPLAAVLTQVLDAARQTRG